jgi:hypothetical protein
LFQAVFFFVLSLLNTERGLSHCIYQWIDLNECSSQHVPRRRVVIKLVVVDEACPLHQMVNVLPIVLLELKLDEDGHRACMQCQRKSAQSPSSKIAAEDLPRTSKNIFEAPAGAWFLALISHIHGYRFE